MKKLSLLIAVLFVAVGLFAKTTTIYHTSDTHGFYYPRNGEGGFAALANVLKHGQQPYLLLDSGDFSNGTVEAKRSKGIKSAQIMNKAGYNATTIGNHEFDFKDAGVEPILKALNFPVLAANFLDTKSNQYPPNVKPYKIFDVDGVKVAVIGLANATPTNATKKYKFKNPIKTLRKILPEVEAQHPNIVAVIVHDSLQDDKHGTKPYVEEIAKKFGGRVHLVFGGHAHKIIQNETINGVLFTESGCHTDNVSKVTVVTDDATGKFVSASSELIALTVAKVGIDKEVAAYADSLKESGMDEVFGVASEDITMDPVVAGHIDGPLNDWIADLGRAYTGTQIFAHNNGGTRVDIKQGPITKRDTVDMHPFENKIVRMTVNGKFLKFLVKKSLLPRSLYTYSGMTITYRNHKGKVKDLQIFVDGKPVQDKELYTLGTNDYIAFGGSEGWPFKRIKDSEKQQVGTGNVRSILEDGIRAQSPLKPIATGRIIEYK
ncbi:MAG: bifunctional metallophosphatase/5'-nucleotidase [Elusimicrobiaceae bacterium]|nr:bifunctional metallophosphatase/5'-nucleotidase [Elusimicrobiaceae bacterium]